MKIEKPNRVVRTYTQKNVADPSVVFPLMCPVREADWIHDWDPLLVLSESGLVEPDCVFVTDDQPNDSIWYVTRHEPDSNLVEMIKITPGVTACKLTIQLRPADGGSEATVTYAHTSLGPEGDAIIESFTQENYEQFMRVWEEQLNHYLSQGTTLRPTDG